MPYQLAPDQTVIDYGSPFLGTDDVQYSPSWWEGKNENERKAVGITWVDPAPSYDQQFYWSHNVPKDLAELKKLWCSYQKTYANSLLNSSDWMVIREAEGGTACPSDWKTYRTEVRSVSGERETKINATTDVPGLQALVKGTLAKTVAGTASNGATEKKKEDGSSYDPKQYNDIANPQRLTTWPTEPS